MANDARGTDVFSTRQWHWATILADSLFLGNDDSMLLLPALTVVGLAVAIAFTALVSVVVNGLAAALGRLQARRATWSRLARNAWRSATTTAGLTAFAAHRRWWRWEGALGPDGLWHRSPGGSLWQATAWWGHRMWRTW